MHIDFEGIKYIRTKFFKKDIRYYNLMYVMLDNGYSFSDCLYYMSCGGIGLDGFKLLDSQMKVDEMLRQNQDIRRITLSVTKGKRQQAIVVSPAKKGKRKAAELVQISDEEYSSDPDIVFAVSEDGVAHKEFGDYVGSSSGRGTDDFLFFGTQQSVNYQPIKTMPPPQTEAYDEYHNSQIEDSANYADMDLDSESEEENSSNEDSADLQSTVADMKKAALHFEGDTEPEDIYDEEAQTEEEATKDEEQHFSEVLHVVKIAKRVGPRSNSHSSANQPIQPGWFPSDDEDSNLGLLDSEDDDGNEPMSFIIH